ncbi:MAG: hypothetical protein JWP12_1812 [Bacteroidetes bacterium]|nr:hypothetical protein [Bacteroidota bacterium]
MCSGLFLWYDALARKGPEIFEAKMGNQLLNYYICCNIPFTKYK